MAFVGALLMISIAVAMGAALIQRHYDLDKITYVPSEIFGRVFALPGAGPAGLRRRLVRSVTTENVVMPSGRILAVDMLAVTVGERDLEKLCPTGALDEFAYDTALTYDRHARRRKWSRDKAEQTRVFILVDPTRQPGWTPRSQLTNNVLGDAAGDSARAPASAQARERVSSQRPTRPMQGAQGATTEASSDTTRYYPPARAAELLGPDERVRVSLATSPTVVGRDDVAASGVSRRHATFEFEGGRWFITDAGSSNGTFVDGRRLDAGEVFELVPGSTTVQFGPGSGGFAFAWRTD